MLITVKAALKFQEGLSGLMPLALQSQNLGLQMKHEGIRNRRAVAVGLTVSFSQGGKGPGVCRDPVNRVSLHLPFAAHSFSAELCSPESPPLNTGSSGMFPVREAWLEHAAQQSSLSSTS